MCLPWVLPSLPLCSNLMVYLPYFSRRCNQYSLMAASSLTTIARLARTQPVHRQVPDLLSTYVYSLF